jgi:hypothetical protein
MSTMINSISDNTQQLKNDWALSLMDKGVIVKLYISRWRGVAQLDPNQFGLKFNNDSVSFMKDYIVFGYERLLPSKIKKEIDAIDIKARLTLKEYSFETLWGRFVPFIAFEHWEKENDIIREKYLKIAKSIYDNYDDIINTIKEEYRQMAIDSWVRLYPNHGNPTESFIENYVSKIIEKIPLKNDLYTSFKYETTYFTIPTSLINKINVSKEDDGIQDRIKKKISEEYLKRKQELIDGFLQETVIYLRENISNTCEDIISLINKNTKNNSINKTQLNRIRGMIMKINIFNFYDDYEIKSLLSELEFEVNKLDTNRDRLIILEKLSKIVEIKSKEFVPSFL